MVASMTSTELRDLHTRLPSMRMRHDPEGHNDDDYIKNTVLRIQAANCVAISIAEALKIVRNEHTNKAPNSNRPVDLFRRAVSDPKSGVDESLESCKENELSMVRSNSSGQSSLEAPLSQTHAMGERPFARPPAKKTSLVLSPKSRLAAIIRYHFTSPNCSHPLITKKSSESQHQIIRPSNRTGGTIVDQQNQGLVAKPDLLTIRTALLNDISSAESESDSENDAKGENHQKYLGKLAMKNGVISSKSHSCPSSAAATMISSKQICKSISVPKWSSALSWNEKRPVRHIPLIRSLSLAGPKESMNINPQVLCPAPPSTPETRTRMQQNTGTEKDDRKSVSSMLSESTVQPQSATGKGIATNLEEMPTNQGNGYSSDNRELMPSTSQGEANSETITQMLENNHIGNNPGEQFNLSKRKFSGGNNLACFSLAENLAVAARKDRRGMFVRSSSRTQITEKRRFVVKSRSLPGDLPVNDNFGVILSPAGRRRLSLEPGVAAGPPPFSTLAFYPQTRHVTLPSRVSGTSGNTGFPQPRARASTETENTLKRHTPAKIINSFRKGQSSDGLLSNNKSVSELCPLQKNASKPNEVEDRTAPLGYGNNPIIKNTKELDRDDNIYAHQIQNRSTTEEFRAKSGSQCDGLHVSKVIQTYSPSLSRRGKERHGNLLYSVDSNSSLGEAEKKKMPNPFSRDETQSRGDYFAHPELSITFPLQSPISGSPSKKSSSFQPRPISSKSSPDAPNADPENDADTKIETDKQPVTHPQDIEQESDRTLLSETSQVCASTEHESTHIHLNDTLIGRYKRKLLEGHSERVGEVYGSGYQKRYRHMNKYQARQYKGVEAKYKIGLVPRVPTPLQTIRWKGKKKPALNTDVPSTKVKTGSLSENTGTVERDDDSGDSVLLSDQSPCTPKRAISKPETAGAWEDDSSTSAPGMPLDSRDGCAPGRRFRCLVDLFSCCCNVGYEGNTEFSDVP